MKRRLKDYRLNRRGENVDDNRLKDLIQQEMAGPGTLVNSKVIELFGIPFVWSIIFMYRAEEWLKYSKS